MDFPFVLFIVSVLGLHLSWRVGRKLRKQQLSEDDYQDFSTINGALLTLLGLLIGFTFSMAVSRYDQRKNYEEEEANAIGTEYVRIELLPAANAATMQPILRRYLEQRVLFYTARNEEKLLKIDAETTRLQTQMWAEVRSGAAAQPSPPVALAVSGLNDVLNRQGYTQAAWLNRIPTDVWILMALIAICSTTLMGYATHTSGKLVSWVLPLAVSISFLLIADIDSPRGGIIRVQPQNLTILYESLRQH